jgi:hypothetical protein
MRLCFSLWYLIVVFHIAIIKQGNGCTCSQLYCYEYYDYKVGFECKIQNSLTEE